MKKNRIIYGTIIVLLMTIVSCAPGIMRKTENTAMPDTYTGSEDTTNSATIKWRDFFKDEHLAALIDTALKNNQELNIVMQEIEILNYEVGARKGEYLPFVDVGTAVGAEKVGRYTSQGANDANTEIMPDKEFPEPLGDFYLGANMSWEIDVWKKLRNAKKAAFTRYLSSIEGRNFLITQLVAEIAENYYELLALDNQLEIVNSYIDIQQNALNTVKQQKLFAKVTELAVKKFEAELLKTKSLQFTIQQSIVEAENRINFLIGRFPQPIARSSNQFLDLKWDSIYTGIPSQLLANRPDIRQAELELVASKIDVDVARAAFYPSIRITAGLGYQAFNPKYLITTPESLLFNLAGDLVAPVINRNAIKAAYFTSNAKQTQAVYAYERSILNAHIEVINQLSKINNYGSSYALREQQVEVLTESVTIAGSLFKSARADYMEVLLTQRDALESKMELVETKQEQMHAIVNLYKALGGGWR
ncbi:TolC family protein [Parvicella tangerina]|uniref:Toluene efflux pump outer membrane protein TtgI n=1 Tax=Parvicella tangerina TaxID=2829795 RepID=A0A916JLT2_9FLAO|nr:TolC family protein [Parvicella tangerina]CAG5080561.1 Toluene efflux pump outer membrane protein TtgI [Parvicella tangerina]